MVSVSCDLLGRLGNQLFQIANVISFCKDNNLTPVFPQIETSHNSKKYRNNIFRKLDSSELDDSIIHSEKGYCYNQVTPRLDKNIMFSGYFQSYKYFAKNRDLILDIFEPTDEITNYINQKYGHLLSDSTSVHIRQGDYLDLKGCYHNLLESSYYTNAMKDSNSSNILVFSDNIEEVKKSSIFRDYKVTFIEGEDEIIDFYLMSMCKNNIIGNSTFSWWAAWINKNEDKKVCAPYLWFNYALSHLNTKDLIPKNWKCYQ